MKLYYSPQLCSLVPHIVLRELGVPFELVRVDFKTKLLADGTHLETITPKSYVPVLELDDGTRLTEVQIVLRWLAETHPEAKLAPPPAPLTMERIRFDELLAFLSTELHKGFAPYTLMPDIGETTKAWTKTRLASRVDVLRTALGDRAFFFGDAFTILDAYAFWALRVYSFLTRTKLEGTLADFMTRMNERPAVKAAVDAEKRGG